ncbi:MAG: transcriptional repressor [Verrucomicrobia bacterium]|nr:transcriptional repressor [Verrucomicrobiota bacterium]
MLATTSSEAPFVALSAGEGRSSAFVELALGRLRQAGLRITQSRIQLLTALGQATEPMSVEELHASVGRGGCDLVTIYRSMLVFEDHGLVQRSYRYNGTTLFERRMHAPPPYRVFCKQTNRFVELDGALTVQLRSAIEALEQTLREQGYTRVSHLFEFFAQRKGVSDRGEAAGESA